MKIWTGKLCLSALVLGLLVLGSVLGCSSGDEKKAAPAAEVEKEVSLKNDRAQLEELRKEIPEEIKRSNDRLAETLARWKAQKMPPDRLREKFNDEIRKARNEMDKKQKKVREDFQKNLADRRRDFLDRLKSDRDSFYATKPKSQQRTDFSSHQQSERDRFFGDERDARADFDGHIKDERKEFEDDIANRWVEFRQEFPEYSRLYKELKDKEAKEREENLKNPKPSTGAWPYKYPGEENQATNPGATNGQNNVSGGSTAPASPNEKADVNKGGNGWPTTDPDEFNQLPGHKSH